MKKYIGITILGKNRILFNENIVKYHQFLKKEFEKAGYECIYFTVIEKDCNDIDYNNVLMQNTDNYKVIDENLKFANLISYIDNEEHISIYEKLKNFPQVDKIMNGCLAQWVKKFIASNLIVNYEKKHNIQFEGFFKIRTDLISHFDIKKIIETNILFMNHDVFAYIPKKTFRDYYIENFKYIISKLPNLNSLNCFYIQYFIDNNIKVIGGSHNQVEVEPGKDFKYLDCIVRKNKNKNEIGLFTHNPSITKIIDDLLVKKIGFKNYIFMETHPTAGKIYYE